MPHVLVDTSARRHICTVLLDPRDPLLQSERMQGFAADPVYAKGEVFAYVGLPQNLKDLKCAERVLNVRCARVCRCASLLVRPRKSDCRGVVGLYRGASPMRKRPTPSDPPRTLGIGLR